MSSNDIDFSLLGDSHEHGDEDDDSHSHKDKGGGFPEDYRRCCGFSLTIKSEKEHDHVNWTGLFYDLILVAIVGNLNHDLEHDIKGRLIIYTVFSFSFIQHLWAVNTFFGRFRGTRLIEESFHMFFMMVNIAMFTFIDFDLKYENMVYFVAIFMAGRLVHAIILICVAAAQPRARHWAVSMLCCSGLDIVLWGVSLYVYKYDSRYMLSCWIAGSVCTFVALFIMGLRNKMLHPNADYTVERTGLYVVLVLGETIIACIPTVSEASHLLKGAFPCFVIAYCIKEMYFSAHDRKKHAVGSHRLKGQIYIFATQFVFVFVAVLSVTLAKYMEDGQDIEHDPEFVRWLMCLTAGGLILLLILIEALQPGLGKKTRLVRRQIRFPLQGLIALVIGLMPLIPLEIMNMTITVATIAGLMALCTAFLSVARLWSHNSHSQEDLLETGLLDSHLIVN